MSNCDDFVNAIWRGNDEIEDCHHVMTYQVGYTHKESMVALFCSRFMMMYSEKHTKKQRERKRERKGTTLFENKKDGIAKRLGNWSDWNSFFSKAIPLKHTQTTHSHSQSKHEQRMEKVKGDGWCWGWRRTDIASGTIRSACHSQPSHSLFHPHDFPSRFHTFLIPTQRIIGLAVSGMCTIVFMILSLLFVPTLLVKPTPFALCFTLGNISAIVCTFFVAGPKKQLKSMSDPKHLTATIIYVAALSLTLVSAILVCHFQNSRKKHTLVGPLTPPIRARPLKELVLVGTWLWGHLTWARSLPVRIRR